MKEIIPTNDDSYNIMLSELKESDRLVNIEEQPLLEEKIVELKMDSHTKIKILWLVEEAYDIEFEGGILWLLSKLVRGDDAYEKYLISQWKQKTWHQIICISYGILNNFMLYDDIPDMDANPKVAAILKRIAIMNIVKLAGRRDCKAQNIKSLFKQKGELIKDHIEQVNANVIIGSKTLHHYYDLFELDSAQHFISEQGTSYYTKNEKLYIDADYLDQLYITREYFVLADYIDDLIQIAKSVFTT